MQAQINGTNIGHNDRMVLEGLYRDLDQLLGHPAADLEVCNEMKISLDKFNRMLDGIGGLSLGRFQDTSCRKAGERSNDPPIRYIPDESEMDSSFVLPESKIKLILTEAIEALPRVERLVISLHYHDELTLKEISTVLKTDEACISKLHTKAVLRLRSKLRK